MEKKDNKKDSKDRFTYNDSTGLKLVSKGKKEETKKEKKDENKG